MTLKGAHGPRVFVSALWLEKMYVQQKYFLHCWDGQVLNVLLSVTTLFSSTSFAACDIFFEVIKARTVVKTLRVTIFSMPRELYLLFKVSINWCHIFPWTNQFSWYEPHIILENVGVPLAHRCQSWDTLKLWLFSTVAFEIAFRCDIKSLVRLVWTLLWRMCPYKLPMQCKNLLLSRSTA